MGPDILYSPAFWLLLNIAVALSILMMRRRAKSRSQGTPRAVEAGPYWRLESLLRADVPVGRQREYLKECMSTFIGILAERGAASDPRPQTVREILTRLGREEANGMVEVYEAVRFGGRTLSLEELEDFRSKLRTLARSVIY